MQQHWSVVSIYDIYPADLMPRQERETETSCMRERGLVEEAKGKQKLSF